MASKRDIDELGDGVADGGVFDAVIGGVEGLGLVGESAIGGVKGGLEERVEERVFDEIAIVEAGFSSLFR